MRPRVWMHKQSGLLACVTPYWITGETKEWVDIETGENSMKIALTAVVQAGWVFQNEHYVAFVMGMYVQDHFEDIGEL